VSRFRIVVVGGGLAGIAAALEAAGQGAEVVLLERRTKLGGLTWSFRRAGRWFDNGQHVFLRCCTAYRGFLDRIGASGLVRLQRQLEVPVLAPSGTRATIARSRGLPAPLHLGPSLVRYAHLSMRERLCAVRAVRALCALDLDDPALDSMTLEHWLERHGQSPQAIDRLWNLVALPTINLPASDASAAQGAMVFRTGLLDRADAGDIGWSIVPLGFLHGDRSMDALDQAGVEVVLGAAVTGVEAHGPSRRLSVHPGDRTHVADAVIVATPPGTAQELLGSAVLPGVEHLGASPIVNVHLVLDRQVTDLAFFACVDSPLQFVFDRTEAAHWLPPVGAEAEGATRERASMSSRSGRGPMGAANREQCLSVSLSAADALIGRRPADLIGSMFEALRALLPGARRAELIDAVVTRERAATFRATPGIAKWRPGPRTRLEGVYVAGAWCRTGWPATMEGAVRSGIEAAREALALGRAPASSPGVAAGEGLAVRKVGEQAMVAR